MFMYGRLLRFIIFTLITFRKDGVAKSFNICEVKKLPEEDEAEKQVAENEIPISSMDIILVS